MEIDFRGANSVVIKSKTGIIVTDPTDDVKANEVSKENAITLLTDDSIRVKDATFVIDIPGEYEHNDISIRGISFKRKIDSDGKKSTIYSVNSGGIRIAIIGHIDKPLEDDLEDLGAIDIVIIPVSGDEYTLNARDAATITRELSPKIVIPTYFPTKNKKQKDFQEEINSFINEMGGLHEKVSSLKIKNGSLPETLTVCEIVQT